MKWHVRGFVLVAFALALATGTWHALRVRRGPDPSPAVGPFGQRDWQAVLYRAEEGLQDDPHDGASVALAARAAVELADWQRAWRYLVQMQTAEPELLWRTGEGLVIERDWLAAATALERLHALAPDRLEVVRRLAAAEWQLGRYPAVTRLAERLAEDNHQRAGGLGLLGDVAHRRERHADAADCYHRALDLDPDGRSLLAPLPLVHFRFSRSLAALGKLNEAQDHAETAQRLAPGPAFEHWCGEVLHGLGKDHEAQSRWCAALDKDNSFYPAAVSLGKVAFARKQPEEAIGWLELAAAHELEADRPTARLIEQVFLHLPQPYRALRPDAGTVLPGPAAARRDIRTDPADAAGAKTRPEAAPAEGHCPLPATTFDEATGLLAKSATLRERFAEAQAAAQAQNWRHARSILEELLDRIPDHPVLVAELVRVYNQE